MYPTVKVLLKCRRDLHKFEEHGTKLEDIDADTLCAGKNAPDEGFPLFFLSAWNRKVNLTVEC